LHRLTVHDRSAISDHVLRFLIKVRIKQDPAHFRQKSAESPLQNVGAMEVGSEFAIYLDRTPVVVSGGLDPALSGGGARGR